MNMATLLHQMCHDFLSQADINAMGKTRGFTAVELSSRTTLENFYLSNIGLPQAMKLLSNTEVALLHLLYFYQQPVPVPFFTPLSSSKQPIFDYSTYTQRYQPIFKLVREGLVRRGLLVMGQDASGGETKMAQWRFAFPAQFGPFLPSPFTDVRRLVTPQEEQSDVLRAKLLELIGEMPAELRKLTVDLPDYTLWLKEGRIYIGERPFRAAELVNWQKAAWQKLIPPSLLQVKFFSHASNFSLLDFLIYLLRLLAPDEWVTPAQLDLPLCLFSGTEVAIQDLCHLGWQFGYLIRQSVNGRLHYRLAPSDTPSDTIPQPDDYLAVINDTTASLNLHTIPYTILEQLNQIAHFHQVGQTLQMTPDLIGIGAAIDLYSFPHVQWLIQHIPAFAHSWAVARQRWGKTIIHDNLHIARVTDLVLRVQLERGLKADGFLLLSEEYVAFSPKSLAKVKRIVAQAGHVIKYYEA